MIWARPAVTVLGIDCPSIDGCTAAIQPEARALISLRIPPGVDALQAQDALIDHLAAVAPWHVQVDFERAFEGQPFAAAVDGPAFAAMAESMREVYGRDVVRQGDGGSIPLCNVLQETFPDAEIMLLGVEEPQCLIHAPNESVDPARSRAWPGRGAVPAEVRLSRVMTDERCCRGHSEVSNLGVTVVTVGPTASPVRTPSCSSTVNSSQYWRSEQIRSP